MSGSDEAPPSGRGADDIRPRIQMPSGGPPTAVILAGFCLLGVALFLFCLLLLQALVVLDSSFPQKLLGISVVCSLSPLVLSQ